jgi:hypothetical protein
MAESASTGVVWGLELGGSAARLVAVRSDGAAWRVESVHQIEVPPQPLGVEDNRYTPNFASLAAAVTGPLAVTIPDEEVLYRSLTLPNADPAVLGKMVQGQLEIMLPTRADHFTSAWQRQGDTAGGERILMAAVKNDSLERAAGAVRALAPAADAVIPSIVALAGGYAAFAAANDEPLALIDIGARSATVAVVLGSRIIEVGTLDREPEEGRRGDDAFAPPTGEWWSDLGDLYRQLIAKLPASERPSRAVVAGRAARDAGVVAACAAALRIGAGAIGDSVGLATPEGVAADEILTAAGAAMALLRPDRAISFVTRRATAPVRRSAFTRRAGVAALWIAAAVVALYLADRREASWLDASVERIAQAAGPGGIDERLAIAAYLNKQAATPLIAYEAMVTALPPPVLPVSWSYARGGEFRFLGRTPDPAQADAYLKKLSETKLFKSVEIKSLRLDPQRGQWEVEIIGVLRGGIPAPPKDVSQPAASAAAVSAPPATTAPAAQSYEQQRTHVGRRGRRGRN